MGLFSKKRVNLQEAKTIYNKGNYRKALKICKDYLDEKENDFEGLNLLGDIYFKLEDKNKSLDNYRKLISILESEKYTDKAIAVIKKVIRQYPDQYDLYRKLSKLFEKKGFMAEQLKILYELSNIYQDANLIDKSIDILKEIVEIDRKNIENYKKLFEVLDSLGKKHELSKLLYPALETAYNKDKFDYLKYFIETALKNDIEFSDSIKFTFEYFGKNKDKIHIFNNAAKQYLSEKGFDKDLFQGFLELNKIDSELDFILELKEKYNDMAIYDVLIDYYLNKNDFNTVKNLFNEIQSLPDFLFTDDFNILIEKYVDIIEQVEILDILVILAGKLGYYDTQIKVYNRLVEIYKRNNDNEKAERILNFIKDIEERESVDENVIGEQINEAEEELIEEDKDNMPEQNFSEMIITSTSLADSESNDDFVITTNNVRNNESTDSNDFELDFELDLEPDEILLDQKIEDDYDVEKLNLEETNEEINAESYEKESDEFDLEKFNEPDFDIFENSSDNLDFDLENKSTNTSNTFDHKIESTEKVASTPVKDDLNSQILEVKNLIGSNKFAEASQIIDKLLLDYPDNDEVKSLSLQVFLADRDFSQDESNDIKEQMADILQDFRKVANSMRNSVNAQVRPDDYETHYDLAMAYMEMELYDEALEELKKSAVGNKRYESLYLMAECYKRMKQVDDAINIHKLIIIDYNDQEILKNSLYEMALILESNGDKNGALNYFSKIYTLDKNFRDVKLRIDSRTVLKNKTKKVDSTNNTNKKKKISFL